MKQLLFFSACLLGGALSGQEMQSISTGNGYNMQSYSQLEAGIQNQVANNAWDIAFNVYPGEAGVFINESLGSGTGATAIDAFYTLSEDFSAVPDTSVYLQFPLMNLEKTWSYGALNEIRNPGDPLDYGWGIKDQGTGDVTGSQVYVIRLRDGSELKLQVQSMIGGVYSFRYAALDGSGEISRTIAKADHAGRLMAYYSFATDAVVDVEPADGFDLLFCRYVALLDDPGGGDPVPYLVTGILSGQGVEVAEANGVDPQTVMFEDYADQLSADLQEIGHDWKYFDLGAFMWVIPDDLVYFVKTADGRVWKVHFLTFGGSGNGIATFEKTDLGLVSGVSDARRLRAQVKVCPNPAVGSVQILFDWDDMIADDVRVQLLDMYGRMVVQESVVVNRGLNAHALEVSDVTHGMYLVRILAGNRSVTEKVVLKD